MSNERPNILFIFTDQHRLSGVGCYGETPCRTPNIDRLAEEGVRFETAYTVCPVCSPARGTVMTGLYPHSHGICSNVHNLGCTVQELPDRPDVLPRRMRSAGYSCGYSGKWHLGTDSEWCCHAPNKPSLPRDVGFDGQNFPGHGNGGFIFQEYKDYLAANGYEHKVRKPEGKHAASMSGGILEGPLESTVPYFLAQNSIDLMEKYRAAGEPFFMWHNFWGPHGPYYATREFHDMYAGVEIPAWPNFGWDALGTNRPHRVKLHPHSENLTWDDWADAVRCYYAFASMIDSQVGRMLDYLDESGLSENTIVVFSSDHGETLGSHGGLTDKGWQHFEEIQRIPFVVRSPRGWFENGPGPGSVRSEWISLADVYPTVLDLAGTESDMFCDQPLHGRSILPILEGHSVEWRDRVFVEFFGVNGLATSMVSVRKGNFKYGWNCSNLDELYDLESDPHEMNNLVDDPVYADKVKEMLQLIDEWMVETKFQGIGMFRQSRMSRPWGA